MVNKKSNEIKQKLANKQPPAAVDAAEEELEISIEEDDITEIKPLETAPEAS